MTAPYIIAVIRDLLFEYVETCYSLDQAIRKDIHTDHCNKEVAVYLPFKLNSFASILLPHHYFHQRFSSLSLATHNFLLTQSFRPLHPPH